MLLDMTDLTDLTDLTVLACFTVLTDLTDLTDLSDLWQFCNSEINNSEINYSGIINLGVVVVVAVLLLLLASRSTRDVTEDAVTSGVVIRINFNAEDIRPRLTSGCSFLVRTRA